MPRPLELEQLPVLRVVPAHVEQEPLERLRALLREAGASVEDMVVIGGRGPEDLHLVRVHPARDLLRLPDHAAHGAGLGAAVLERREDAELAVESVTVLTKI